MPLAIPLRLMILLCATLCASALLLQAAITPCVGDNLSGVTTSLNIDFHTTIQPIFNTRCASCHTGGVQFGNPISMPPARSRTS
jgi:hypothetical protein